MIDVNRPIFGLFLLVIVLMIFIADKIGLWLEQKGWLYYRNEKPQNVGFGNALHELHAFISPSTRYVVEMKQHETNFKKNESVRIPR